MLYLALAVLTKDIDSCILISLMLIAGGGDIVAVYTVLMGKVSYMSVKNYLTFIYLNSIVSQGVLNVLASYTSYQSNKWCPISNCSLHIKR